MWMTWMRLFAGGRAMSYNEMGNGRTGKSGAPEIEELGMGSFGIVDTVAASRKVPSFKPEQLEAFGGTGYELIPLNAWDALSKDGRKIGKAPGKGWRIVDPMTIADAAQAMAERRNVGVRLRLCDLVVDVDPRNLAGSSEAHTSELQSLM